MSDEKKTERGVGVELGAMIEATLGEFRVICGRMERAADRIAGGVRTMEKEKAVEEKPEPAEEKKAEKKAEPAEEKKSRGRSKSTASKSSAKDEKKEKEELLAALRPKLSELKDTNGKDFVRELIANYNGKRTLASLDLEEVRGLTADVEQALSPAADGADDEDGDDW